ncbi:hypothetical protein RJT34_20183 [Clitoria ternatea]|uniref:Uncharacterized protein n=1 Tax=Clitoria ternatea TaxID=43366 RepID=A0AAN9ISD7_CLITE
MSASRAGPGSACGRGNQPDLVKKKVDHGDREAGASRRDWSDSSAFSGSVVIELVVAEGKNQLRERVDPIRGRCVDHRSGSGFPGGEGRLTVQGRRFARSASDLACGGSNRPGRPIRSGRWGLV